MSEPVSDDQQLVDLLEWLAAECDVAFDRVVARRAIQEARQGWPGSEEEQWWKWLIEAGDSMGLRVRVVELTFQQALETVREKTLAVRLPHALSPWLLIHRQRRRRFHIVTADNSPEGRWVTASRLSALMNHPPAGERLTWVVVEPAVTCHSMPAPGGTAETPPARPLDRLTGLLKAERSDIWIVLVFALFVGLLGLTTPLAIEVLVSTVAFGRTLQPIIVLSVILFAFLAFSALVQAVEKYVVELIQQRLFVRIAADLAWRLPRVHRAALDHQYGPELANRFFDVVTVQKVVATLLIDALDLIIVTVAGMVVLALFHPLLLGLELILMALILFALFVLGRGGVDSSITESKYKYAMAAWLENVIRSQRAVKLEGGYEYAVEHADQIARRYLTARQTHFRVLFRQILFNLTLYAIGSAVLFGVGGILVVRGQLSLGQLVGAELIVSIVLGSAIKMSKHLEGFYDLMASVDKLGTLFDLPLERQDGLLSVPGTGPLEIRLRDVGFRYSVGPPVLSGFSLTVPPGQVLGIHAPPGAGKTTLAELLFGLRRATSGNIEFNGIDADDLRPDVLRHHVALAAHPVEILDGTVSENVHLDRVEVNSTVVHESLQQVGLLETVFLLPDGLETPLTADGTPLSETQQRRLVLARALAGRPRLLIIDSLLDSFSDDDGLDLLRSLTEPDNGCTIILFSGRQRLLSACDRTLQLNRTADSSPTAEQENP